MGTPHPANPRSVPTAEKAEEVRGGRCPEGGPALYLLIIKRGSMMATRESGKNEGRVSLLQKKKKKKWDD